MKKIFAASACVLIMLAGCRSPSPEGAQLGMRVDDAGSPNARVMYDQVVIVDKALQSLKAGKLAIESQGVRRTGTGTLNVIVQIRNRTDFNQVLEARTSFFDSGYVPTENPSGWSRIHLGPNGVATYQELSVGTANVAHYYVEIREAG